MLVLAVLTAGCGGGSEPSSTGVPATPTAQPSSTEETTAEGPTTSAATTTTAALAPCAPAEFLPLLKRVLDGQAPKLTIVRADVERCRNGYAQVFAVPDRTVCEPGVGYCYETEQFFLRWTGERWRVAASGTGLTCGAETDPEIVEICRALGYADLSTRTFQMPSRNIGCLFGFQRLRCDILSGLDPAPAAVCDFDWVGVDMGVTGPATANCGSDTVYQAGAPTLAYGSTWARGGIVCESRQSGLHCANREGHEFTLARGSWSAT